MDNTKIIVGMRFDNLVKALNHSIPSFAKALDYERCDKLYNIQKGKYYPSFEILQDITKYFVDVNIDWIISGRGFMFQSEEQTKATPILTTTDTESLIYKMYKEEREAKEKLLKEIGRLEERLNNYENMGLDNCDSARCAGIESHLLNSEHSAGSANCPIDN